MERRKFRPFARNAGRAAAASRSWKTGGCWELSRCPDHPTGQALCPKGRAAPELVYHPERVTRPLRRTQPKGAADPGWEPIGWDEALAEISTRLADIRAAHGAEQVAFSVTTPSGSHISDLISWVERFIRAYGSPNTIYGTEICNWHKDYASRFTYGHDIGTPDFANTDCVVLWGNNPAATWLARQVEIQKGLKSGARMIVIDPRPTALAKRCDPVATGAPRHGPGGCPRAGEPAGLERTLRSRLCCDLDKRQPAGALRYRPLPARERPSGRWPGRHSVFSRR